MVEDGAVVVLVDLAPGADESSVKDALDRFAITWRLELS
jgi:fatty-acyl-CoA synthase